MESKELTNEQILKKAIEKAVENGLPNEVVDDVLGNPLRDLIIKTMLEEGLYRAFIFRHDFAKVFWGEETVLIPRGKAWQYHLQIMVLEKEPLRYLEKFLDD